jgi:RNA polymerase sigma factor (sigma-70 family)
LHNQINIQEHTVLKAIKGDFGAQAELYRLYGKAMFNICIRMTGNKTDAEDVLQDSFIHAFAQIKQVRQPAAFGGWLRQIVVNKCILLSKRNFKWDDLHDDLNYIADDDVEDWWSSLKLDMVHEEIKNLPDGCRQVFLLYVLEEYSHKTIAANLGISESTSKSQYQRARQLLKERITKKIPING